MRFYDRRAYSRLFYSPCFVWALALVAAAWAGGREARAADGPATFASWETTISRAEARNDQQWTALIEDLETDQTVYAYHPERDLIPASNRKLVTFGLALDTFGPDYQFKTDWGLDGELGADRSSYTGNVIIIAKGDPSISAPFIKSEKNPLDIFRQVVRSLTLAGISSIHGNVVLDASAFGKDQDDYPESWDLSNRNNSFASVPSAMAINQNLIRVDLNAASRTGSPARMSIYPSSTGVDVDNSTRSRDEGGNGVSAKFGSDNVSLQLDGTVGRRGSESILVPLRRPLEYAADNLREMLKDAKISVDGQIMVKKTREAGEAPAELKQVLGSYASPPLAEILKVMMRNSDNFIAEQLWRASAARQTSLGDIATAREVEKKWYAKQGQTGIEPGWDGSGLSRQDHISAHEQVEIVRYLYHTPYREVVMNCLPVSGRTGTLRGRSIGGSSGRVTAKTGTLLGVSSLTGYIHDKKGAARYAFSIIGNAPSETNGLLTTRIDQLLGVAIRQLDTGRLLGANTVADASDDDSAKPGRRSAAKDADSNSDDDNGGNGKPAAKATPTPKPTAKSTRSAATRATAKPTPKPAVRKKTPAK